MKRFLLIFLALVVALGVSAPAEAHKKDKNVPPKIIFIPHDNRPISDKQTAEVAKKLGFDVVVPPDEALGSRDYLGTPDELWQWLEENAEGAQAAVISSDSMLYGSLVGSRKHEYSKKEVLGRAERFKSFAKDHPDLPLYVFGSIMRTPRTGEASGHEEPSYYRNYGADIFRYTELNDKAEVEGLTKREKKEQVFLEKLIPQKSLQDWMGRREKNLAASERLIELTRDNSFHYLILGRDDNAPYSQTHLESRHLTEKGADLGKTRFQAMAGIDEMGMLLLTRAVNEMKSEMPFVYVRYNWGRGGYTIPSYSDERISDSINDAVLAAGGLVVRAPEKADLVLMVNTNPNGKTYEANDRSNTTAPREGTDYFAQMVADGVQKGWPVCIADIAYANGSDNALMEKLKEKSLLFKVRAYAGWNTPTNSTGFVIGEGMLTKHMTSESIDDLLLTRYLDDWAYQANVRNIIARQLTWLRGDGVYGSLGSKREAVENRTQKFLARFVEDNLPPMEELTGLVVRFPWNRMFESDIILGEEIDPISFFKH